MNRFGKPLFVVWVTLSVSSTFLFHGSVSAQDTATSEPADSAAEADQATDDKESASTAQPATMLDPQIPIDQLAVLVKPLTKSQLEIEAEAWFDLLRTKAEQVAAARLSVSKTNEALSSGDQQLAKDSLTVAESVKQRADQQAAEVEQQMVDSARQQMEGGSDDDTPSSTADEADGPPTVAEGAGSDGSDAADAVPTAATPVDTEEPDGESDNETAVNPEEAESQGEGSDLEADAAILKENLLSELPMLQDQRAEVSDRFSVVLDSLERKGGDVTEYRLYVNAVSGIELDTTDWSTAWAGISGWAASKEGGQRWLWNIAEFLIVIALTLVLAKVIAGFVNWLLERKVHLTQLAERLISRIIKDVVMLVGFAVALTTLEIDITPIIAAIGATGLVVGLALQGTLSNFASGLMILINRPFDVGDVVTAGGITGLVDQMNLVSTTFRTFDNQTIHVPNNEIWNNVITNITANETRRVDLEFGVGYGDDFEHAERVIQDVVSAHKLVLDDPAPAVVTHALGDSSVNIVCRPWAKTSDWWTVKTDITREVKRRFDAEGISIPYPHRDVYVHQVAETNDK